MKACCPRNTVLLDLYSCYMICRICEDSGSNKLHTVKEMMFGLKHEFRYLECLSCGCLQITEYPPDISVYYPSNYYAFDTSESDLKKSRWLQLKLAINLCLPKKMKSFTYGEWMINCSAKVWYKILDIGCGRGHLLCDLFNMGFHNVEGVDKYVPEQINYEFGVKVLKKELAELPGNYYDILMMHHVLEHMGDQLSVLKECYRILKSGRYLMIRIPVKNYAWEKYKTDWIQIDAPRHYYIHTVESFKHLVSKTAFTIKKIVFDSSEFQFWGSEQYKKDIPLMAPNSYFINPGGSIFSENELTGFNAKAKELNLNNSGDQAAFYLYKE